MTGSVEEPGWEEVAAPIVLGVAHEINNRLLALMGLRELAEDGLDAELLQLFDDELTRLETANRLLRRLGEPPSGPELVEGGALLETVRELHALNSALRGVATEWALAQGLPAVRADPVRATRGLLAALHAGGHAAADSGTALRVSAGADAGGLVVEVRPAAVGAETLRTLEASGATTAVTGETLRARFAPS